MKEMKGIMFVCHGNICRSPMAEYIMKNELKKRGLADKYYVASAGTSAEELGNFIYPPAAVTLLSHGISAIRKRACQLTFDDRYKYDLFIGMDDANIRNMKRILGEDAPIYKMMSFVGSGEDVRDPWYHDCYDETYDDCERAIAALIPLLESGEI